MTSLSTTLNAGTAIREGSALHTSGAYTENSNGKLACTIRYTGHVDLQDMIALVCQSGPRQGEIGQIVTYFGQKVNVAFDDGMNESFSGPSLDGLERPSPKDYGVEPFYIGDLAKDRRIHSSSDDSEEILESMRRKGRTHLGLMRLCGELGRHPVEYSARRVQKILKVRALQNIRLGAR